MFKKLQLYFGATVILLILLMILFPSFFTSINPYATEGLKSYVDGDGVYHLEKAPFAPQSGMLMGTDELGRHIWPLIVYGTKLTMTLAFLIVILRFVLAIPLGFLAGFGSLTAHGIIDKLARFFGTIPTLLLCIIILKMEFFIGLDKNMSILSFVLLLGFVGFGKTGIVIEERVASIVREPFVKGDIAIGKNKIQIAVSTVFRHLYSELIVMFFLEFARALTLLLQLGLFAVFVGNVRFIEDSSSGGFKTMDISYEPEWASMLGAARNNIRSAPWIVFFPAMAFFISVLGANAFGESLRNVLNGQLKFKKPNRIAMSIILVVVVSLTGLKVWQFYNTNYGFELESNLLNQVKLEDEPVLLGNANAVIATAYMENQLIQRGFKPLKGNTIIQGYKTEKGYYTKEGTVNLDHVDITNEIVWISHGDFDVEASVVDMRNADLYDEHVLDHIDTLEKSVLLLDGQFYSELAIENISKRLSISDKVAGLVWIKNLDRVRQENLSQLNLKVPVFYLSHGYKMSDSVETHDIKIYERFANTGDQGQNLYAILPGTSPTMGEEAIVLGLAYNAEDKYSFEKLMQFNLSVIDEVIGNEVNRKRTLIVMFIDGTMNDTFNGINDYASQSLYSQKDVLLYVDLTRVNGIESGKVIFDQNQSPISRYFAYTFAMQFAEKLDKASIKPAKIENPNWMDQRLYDEKGFPTLIIGLKEDHISHEKDLINLKELGQMITTVINQNNY
ncbi:ABC transporter permease [Fusibacter bizertensis]